MTPSPHPGQGAYTGTLWDPLAKIAPGQVAGNSNLKFGVRPRPLRDKSRPSGTSACTPSHIRSRQMSRAVSLGFPWGSNLEAAAAQHPPVFKLPVSENPGFRKSVFRKSGFRKSGFRESSFRKSQFRNKTASRRKVVFSGQHHA